MSLLNKSKISIKSSEILIEKELYNSSFHCSYYAVFQHLKYKCLSNENFENDLKYAKKKKGSHNFVIDYFFKIKDKKEYEPLKKRIKYLKNQRVIADYKNKLPSEKEIASRCYDLSNKVLKCLRK